MAAFDFENDSLFEEAVRKAVKKPTGSVSHVDVQSIAELWCSADVTPSNLMKLAPHTFVHLIAAGPQRAVLDGVILDVVGSTGSSPTIGRAFIAGRSVRINGREKFFPGLGTVDGFLPGTLAPTVDGTAFVPGVFSGNNFLPGLASHPAFGHKGDAFIPGMMLPLNTLPGQQMLETLQQALGTRLPRGLDLRSSIANQNALFIPGTFSNATTFQRGVSIEYGRCATGGFDIDRAMSGRARVADECGKYTSGFGQKEFQCGGTAMVCKDQKTASMGERATRVLKAITETDFKPGMKKEEAVYEIVRTASRVTTDLAEYEADTASSPAECTIFRVDGDVITKKAIALEENQYIEVKKDGSVAKTTWDQETRTATDTEQILPPTPVNEPNSGTSQSKPESGGTCEEPKPFLLPPPVCEGGMPADTERDTGSVPAWLQQLLSAWGVTTKSSSPVLWNDPTVLPTDTEHGQSGAPTFKLPPNSNVDPTGSDESGHSGSSGGGIVIQTAGDPTEGHQAGGLTVLSPGATPPHGLSVRPHKTSVHGRPRAIRQIEQGMGPTPVATGAGTKLRDTAMTATLKSMEGIRADALREAQSVEHYCLLVVMASKRSQLPSAYYTRELQLLFDKVFAGIPME